MNSSSKERAEENDMIENFPAGGDPLDIPDVGVATNTEVDVEALLSEEAV